MVFFFAGHVFAAIDPQTFSAGVVGGGYFPDSDEHLDDSALIGFKLGYDFTSNFGLEVAGDKIRTKSDRGYGDSTYDLLVPRMDYLYYLLPDDAIVPYLSVGIGGRTKNSSDGDSGPNQFLTNIGLGVKCFFNKHFAVRGDIKYLHLFNDAINNYEATLGLLYKFGSTKKVSHPKVYDSDQDGVPDTKDLCGNTPFGVKVDAKGCPLDSDSDGVPNYLDKCPATPLGSRIDRDGCPVDDMPFEFMSVDPSFQPATDDSMNPQPLIHDHLDMDMN